MKSGNTRLLSASRDVPISSIKWSKSERTITGAAHLEASLALHAQAIPIVLNADLEVIDGHRTVAAAVALGWSKVWAVTVADLKTATDQMTRNRTAKLEPAPLRMTFAEAVAKAAMLEQLDRTSFNRDLRKTNRDPNRHASGPGSWEHAIATAVGLTSGTTYKRARSVVRALSDQSLSAAIREAAVEAYALMETTGSAERGYRALREAKNPPPNPTAGEMGADGLPETPPPEPGARGSRATELRIAWTKAMGAQGASIEQIADKLRIEPMAVQRLVRRHGIHVPAARVLARQQRRERDHNRAVTVALEDLDALVWSLDTVDVERLTAERLGEWAAALHGYAVQIDRVSRRMREGITASDNDDQ